MRVGAPEGRSKGARAGGRVRACMRLIVWPDGCVGRWWVGTCGDGQADMLAGMRVYLRECLHACVLVCLCASIWGCRTVSRFMHYRCSLAVLR
eukprot:7086454-Alexandrium_andersonii.AAC.1